MNARKQRKRGIAMLWVWGALEAAWVCLYLFDHDTELWSFAMGTLSCLFGAAAAIVSIRKVRKTQQTE